MKNNASSIRRFQRLGRTRQKLLIGATFALAGASAAVALLPFRSAIRVGCARLKVKRDCAATAAHIVWAIETMARRLPWRTVCIEQGIAVQRMLRRRGIDAQLHYGIRHENQSGKLEAHVWVSVGKEIVIGGAEANSFAPVAAYP